MKDGESKQIELTSVSLKSSANKQLKQLKCVYSVLTAILGVKWPSYGTVPLFTQLPAAPYNNKLG